MREAVSRDRLALLAGFVGPLVAAVALVPVRDRIANTSAALVLVLLVAAVALADQAAVALSDYRHSAS